MEVLLDAYRLVEEARIDLWNKMYRTRYGIDTGEITGDPGLIKTEVVNGIIHITIQDIPPRAKGIDKAELQFHWLGIMQAALQDVDLKFEHALCEIVLYIPGRGWDVDRRVYHYIIDGLRFNGIIKDDTWDKLSFMVTGYGTKDNPRTEIFIQEYAPFRINIQPKTAEKRA